MKPETERLVDSLRQKEKIKVLFVCLGNICRSPAAEGVMKSIAEASGEGARWEIDSAGTGDYHIGDLPDRRMRVHASRRGLTLDHRCRQIKSYDFEELDIIIGMDDSNLQNLHRLSPSVEAERKIAGMAEFFTDSRMGDAVPDPYYEGSEGFELVLDMLDDACNNLYRLVTPSY